MVGKNRTIGYFCPAKVNDVIIVLNENDFYSSVRRAFFLV
jgi:hypothetical protein